MDGYGTTHTDTLSQTVTIPAGCTATTFSFWLHVDTAETTTTTAFDQLTVQVNSTTLATLSNLDKGTGYAQRSFDVSSLAGQTVTVKFTGTEDASLQTSFVVDDVDAGRRLRILGAARDPELFHAESQRRAIHAQAHCRPFGARQHPFGLLQRRQDQRSVTRFQRLQLLPLRARESPGPQVVERHL